MSNNQNLVIRDLIQSFALEMAKHVSAMETVTPFAAKETHEEIQKAWETLDNLTEFLFNQKAAEMLNDCAVEV